MNSPNIETERLLLQWPNAEQIEGFYASIVGSDMFDCLVWDGPQDSKELHDYWKSQRASFALGPTAPFSVAMIERASERYIGGAALRPVDDNPQFIDLGYALDPEFHGQGYATEAVGALVREGYEERGAERIFARIFAGHTASRHVVEKLGFKFEGTERRCHQKRGEWVDAWILASIRPEWEAANGSERHARGSSPRKQSSE